MKEIRIYVLHQYIKTLERCIDTFCLSDLQKKYKFVWDEDNPQYLIVSEHIYYHLGCAKRLKKYMKKGVITIFWAGECISPDLNIFDYAVSWDRNMIVGDRVTRVPPTDVFFKRFATDADRKLNIDAARELLKGKEGFCNFIYSNANAHPMRDTLFRRISEYKTVDSLGKHLNNVGTRGTGYVGHAMESTELKSKYKFSIASENAEYDGYTSEKILTSFQAHTIPIYWGNPHIEYDYNENAFINVRKYKSFEDLLSEIKKIDESDELWCEMVSQPWQTDEQVTKYGEQMERYNDFFVNIFEQDTEKAHRAPVGTHPNHYKDWFLYSMGKRNIKKELLSMVRLGINKICKDIAFLRRKLKL